MKNVTLEIGSHYGYEIHDIAGGAASSCHNVQSWALQRDVQSIQETENIDKVTQTLNEHRSVERFGKLMPFSPEQLCHPT